MKIGDDLARHADVSDDVRGADVVVLAGDTDLEALARRAPASVVLVAGDDLEDRCGAIYAATLFPRGRIIGTRDPAAAAESILFERGDEHDVVALADGDFASRRARLGRGGIRELL